MSVKVSKGAVQPPFVDLARVVRAFSRVAKDYGQHDFLVREIDQRMQERLDYVRVEPQRILDLGCARGASLPELASRYPAATLFGLDASFEMLHPLSPSQSVTWSQRLKRWLGKVEGGMPCPLVGDACQLPLQSGQFDLIWSNLLLHWLADPLLALREMHRVMKVGGLLMFSTLGPDTLKELRTAFADGQSHTQRFVDMHDFGDMLVECGFSDPVMDMEVITLTYDHFSDLLADLRSAGSHVAMRDAPRGLTGKTRYQDFIARLESLRREGKLPATFEVIYGHAWKAAAKQTADGRSVVNFMPKPQRSGRLA